MMKLTVRTIDRIEAHSTDHLPTLVILIVKALVIFRDFFTRLCYLASMVDIVPTEEDDDEISLKHFFPNFQHLVILFTFFFNLRKTEKL